MIPSLHFVPEVEQDAVASYKFYESKSTGLGEDFLRIFYDTAEGLKTAPEAWPVIHRDQIRRVLLHRFPYSLYYRIEQDRIVVLAAFHWARNPRSILEELDLRNEP